MQARRVGIEAAQPQCRDRNVFGRQVPYLTAKRPLNLQVLRLDPPDGFGNLGGEFPRFPDLALQSRAFGSRRPRAES